MSDSESDDSHPGSPLQWTSRVLRGAWRDLKSIYYANTPIWRGLKSAALVFLGLFCWAGANLLLSYLPDQGWLYVVLSYGFLLLFWGPLTHLVFVPLIIRWRRTAQHPVTRWLSRHGSKVNLTVFFVLVLVLAAFPLGIMTFQFQLPAGGGDGTTSAQLQCTRSGDNIHCHISDSRGIDHVRVLTDTELLLEDREPPFDFDVAVGDLQEVRGEKRFTVELRDANDELIRSFRRPLDLIPGDTSG